VTGAEHHHARVALLGQPNKCPCRRRRFEQQRFDLITETRCRAREKLQPLAPRQHSIASVSPPKRRLFDYVRQHQPHTQRGLDQASKRQRVGVVLTSVEAADDRSQQLFRRARIGDPRRPGIPFRPYRLAKFIVHPFKLSRAQELHIRNANDSRAGNYGCSDRWIRTSTSRDALLARDRDEATRGEQRHHQQCGNPDDRIVRGQRLGARAEVGDGRGQR
jgi:hypothetical protein